LSQINLSLTLPPIPDWDWPTFLESLSHFGVDLSLERMQVLLQRLGQPQVGIPAIHVAGTNGKGSVCAWVSHVLWAAGYRVGRYTSPHLVDWRGIHFRQRLEPSTGPGARLPTNLCP